MGSATKFIDYFIHDMLDYTLLNQNSTKFTKNVAIFNIQTSINEILETLEDKIKMKNIKLET